jgi:magnesium transporter
MISAWAYMADGAFLQRPSHTRFKDILADVKNLLWVDFEDPTENETALLRDVFDFHPLLVEDCEDSHSQPKIDQFEDYFFLVIHSCFYYKDKAEQEALSIRELDIFVGKNYVITFHKGQVRSVSTNRKRCEQNSYTMSRGVDFLLYNILDVLVDNYFPILDTISERLDRVEEEILSNPRPELQAKIFALKRSIVTVRKFIGPQRELMGRFLRTDFPFIRQKHRLYFKDIYDHIIRIYDMTESARELISADMEAYLSAISFKLNDIMKTLTIIATLVLPLTLITGFYGMNIQIPEFRWGIKGYLFVCGIMMGAAVGMLVYFKKRKLI